MTTENSDYERFDAECAAIDAAKQRFERHVDKRDDGCWVWNGAHDAYGYGLFSLRRRVWKAHRAAYDLYIESLPEADGVRVKVTCGVRGCVAPEHLAMSTADTRGPSRYTKKARKPDPNRQPWPIRSDVCEICKGFAGSGENQLYPRQMKTSIYPAHDACATPDGWEFHDTHITQA
jgi:hypothetical protein